jgi:hypothetical protein
MKRIAAFAVAAVFAGGAAFAQDGPAGPSTPQVPAPVIHNGLPTNAPAGTAPRTFSLTSVLKKPTAAPVAAVSAPAVVHPMPPLPTGLTAAPLAVSPAACASPAACSTSPRGDCCERLKRWLTFRPCEVHLPCTPTPCYAPLYESFACKPNAGYAGGCAPAAGCATGGRGLFARTPKEKCAPDCDPRTGPVDAGLPGFRFAAPENPAIGAGHAAPGTVVNTSFKMPVYGAKK